MARLFLVRHGEPAGAYGVDADPGLSAAGHAQAQAIAQMASAWRVGAIWTSPLQRCRQTAAPTTALLGIEAQITPAAAEVETPEGVEDRRAWLMAAFPRIADRQALPTHWAEIGLSGWRDRVVEQLLKAQADVAVFTHFIAINAAVSAALATDETIVCQPGHTGVAEFEIKAGQLVLIRAPNGPISTVS
jgi:broad specificity phosphatase PhoE